MRDGRQHSTKCCDSAATVLYGNVRPRGSEGSTDTLPIRCCLKGGCTATTSRCAEALPAAQRPYWLPRAGTRTWPYNTDV